MCWVTGKTGGGRSDCWGLAGRQVCVVPCGSETVLHTCQSRCGLVSVFVLDRTDSLCVIFRLFGFEALQRKQTSIGARRRPGHGSEAGSACLRNRVLSSPVSCQNRKGQGRKWRLCVLAAGPALPDSDPAGQEQQTLSGRNPRRGSWCYFYHFFFFFTKHSMGCFSQLLTQLWVVSVFKTVRHSTERDSSPACSNSIGREPHMAAVSV